MTHDIFSAVYSSNVEMEFCRRSVVGTNCFWSERGCFFFFSVWLPNGTNHGISSLSVYSLGLSKKKLWLSSLFTASILIIIISTHSLSGRSFFFFFFQILILYEHAYILRYPLISLALEQGLIPFLAPFDEERERC